MIKPGGGLEQSFQIMRSLRCWVFGRFPHNSRIHEKLEFFVINSLHGFELYM